MFCLGGKFMVKTILLILIVILLCKTTLASYSISIYLHQFSNPGHKLSTGEACDRDTRYDQCEHGFRICLDYPNGTYDDHGQCRVKEAFSQNMGNWTISQVSQPWQGAILMKVYVTDRDLSGQLEYVDTLSHVINIDLCRRSPSEANKCSKGLTMNGTHTNLTLALVAYCNKDWKGPQCDCDDTKQNYYCDHDGNKTCHNNWYGPQCDVECIAADGINEHYECSSSGTKDCHDGFYGEDCDKYCKPIDDDNGHYTCDQNGNKICNKNWCGENCDAFCGEVHTAGTEIEPRIISSTSDENDPESSDEEIESKTKAGKMKLIMIIGGVAGFLTLLIIGLTVFFCKRKKRLQIAQIDISPMRTMSTPEGHNYNGRMNEGLYHIATRVGPGYEDCFPNLAARKPQACAAASASTDIYAVPDKKRKTQKQGDLDNVSDDMLIVENELYGSASEEKQTQSHKAGVIASISDDMLIVDNELYGQAAEVKETQSHKVGGAANISDDMLIVDNELYGSAS